MTAHDQAHANHRQVLRQASFDDLFASNPTVPIGIEPMMISQPSRAALRGEDRDTRNQSRFPCKNPIAMDMMSRIK